MTEDDDSDAATRLAIAEIERYPGWQPTTLELSGAGLHGLDRIPDGVRALSGVTRINLDYTRVSDLSPLASLTMLQDLSLTHTAVTDLSPLRGLTGLRKLSLMSTAVTDLTPLQGLTALQELLLDGTGVFDLGPLQGLTNLRVLGLTDTPVADLGPLSGLAGLRELRLGDTAVTDLTPLRGVTGLQRLSANNTDVADLTPLQDMQQLDRLSLNHTRVVDLSPLRGLHGLWSLSLDHTAVADLRPILNLMEVGHSRTIGYVPLEEIRTFALNIDGTPAIRRNPELRYFRYFASRSVEIGRKAHDFLKGLPPLPDPLPWTDDAAPAPTPVPAATLLQRLDRPVWHYSPADDALKVSVSAQVDETDDDDDWSADDAPDDHDAKERQQQAEWHRMMRVRVADLIASLGPRIASGGLRQDMYLEARRLQDILAEESLSFDPHDRTLALWTSNLAIGTLLDASDAGTRSGRDPQDLLPPNARVEAKSFLRTSAGLFEGFDITLALRFRLPAWLTTKVEPQTVLSILEHAHRSAFIAPRGKDHIQRLALISQRSGRWADTANLVVTTAVRNLLLVAGLLASRADGAAVAVFASAEREHLAARATDFVGSSADWIARFISTLPQVDRAGLTALLENVPVPRGVRRSVNTGSSPASLSIRSLLPADEPAWRVLWSQYLAFYRTDLQQPVTDRTWARLCDPLSPLTGRVAEVDGQVVGFALHHWHLSTWGLAADGYLEDLFVTDAARGMGLGRALIDDLVDLARAAGWSRLYWHTNAGNTRARALYDRYVLSDGHIRYRIIL